MVWLLSKKILFTHLQVWTSFQPTLAQAGQQDHLVSDLEGQSSLKESEAVEIKTFLVLQWKCLINTYKML